MDFTSAHNVHESAIFDAVKRAAPGFPGLAGQADLFVDVACVALNRMPPRYIRHDADLAIFLTDKERVQNERLIKDSVHYAYEFVQARHAMAARR